MNREEIKLELDRREMLDYAHRELNQQILGILRDALAELRNAKPKERNELARRYAVTITMLEKVIAYFQVYACEE
jgi:hypothetical protein